MRKIIPLATILLVATTTGCLPVEMADGTMDPADSGDVNIDDTGDDTDPIDTDRTPPEGSTTGIAVFDLKADVRGIKIYCELESNLVIGSQIFVDGYEIVNELSDDPLGSVEFDLTIDNQDPYWCDGFVTTESNPPVWNKLLVDDRGAPNSPRLWFDACEFKEFSCVAAKLVHDEPPSADNSWDTQWGLKLSYY